MTVHLYVSQDASPSEIRLPPYARGITGHTPDKSSRLPFVSAGVSRCSVSLNFPQVSLCCGFSDLGLDRVPACSWLQHLLTLS